MSAGQAPTPSDLAAAAAAGAAPDPAAGALGAAPDSLPDADGRPGMERQRSRVGRVVAGLSEEEVEVMRLRDESATMMETLVRAKVEAAEVQGDYLKTRRALIRAVEKQAAMAERLDALKTAIFEGAPRTCVLPCLVPCMAGALHQPHVEPLYCPFCSCQRHRGQAACPLYSSRETDAGKLMVGRRMRSRKR